MSEMVERVKAAIRGADLQSMTERTRMSREEIEKMLAECEADYEAMARAAIEAMEEPTDAMADAGEASNFGEPATAAWRAMIDKALSD